MPSPPDDRPPPRARSPRRRSNSGSDGSREKKKSGLSRGAIVAIVAACSVPVLCGVGLVLVSLLLPAIQEARDAARRSRDYPPNDLKQIGLAIYNYESQHKQFPSQVREEGRQDGRGTELPVSEGRLGWMAALLPFLDEGALYQQLHGADGEASLMSVPFDDPRVAPIYSTRVETYVRTDSSPKEGPNGLALAHFAGNAEVLGTSERFGFPDLRDGTTTTLLGGEVNAATGAPAAWGDPDNLRHAAAPLNSPTGFGGNDRGKLLLLTADATVREVSSDIDPAVLRALGTPDGGDATPGF